MDLREICGGHLSHKMIEAIGNRYLSIHFRFVTLNAGISYKGE